MRVVYRFVDKDGDDIDTRLFKPGHDIPVAVKSVEFIKDFDHDQEPDAVIFTYEYLLWVDKPVCTYCTNPVERLGDQCVECRNSR